MLPCSLVWVGAIICAPLCSRAPLCEWVPLFVLPCAPGTEHIKILRLSRVLVYCSIAMLWGVNCSTCPCKYFRTLICRCFLHIGCLTRFFQFSFDYFSNCVTICCSILDFKSGKSRHHFFPPLWSRGPRPTTGLRLHTPPGPPRGGGGWAREMAPEATPQLLSNAAKSFGAAGAAAHVRRVCILLPVHLSYQNQYALVSII